MNEREHANVSWNGKDIEALFATVENNGGHRPIEKEYSLRPLIF
jgi:hypothetical protein